MTNGGNKYILVVMDCFITWPEAIPMKNKGASTIAGELVNQAFSRHGVPLEGHMDQGRYFESQLIKNLAELLKDAAVSLASF